VSADKALYKPGPAKKVEKTFKMGLTKEKAGATIKSQRTK